MRRHVVWRCGEWISFLSFHEGLFVFMIQMRIIELKMLYGVYRYSVYTRYNE